MNLIILTLLLFSLFSINCVAENDFDINYEGVLGSDYSVSENDEGENSDSASNRVVVNDNVSYQPNEGLFYIYCNDIKKPFSSNVVDGMATQDAVVINVPTGVSTQLYLDGVLCSEDYSSLTQPGTYVLNIQTNSGSVEKVMSFYIVSETCGFLNKYTVPDGFVLESVVINGEEITNNGASVDLENEGEYVIKYSCTNTKRMYSISTIVDHTAPVLALEAVENGKAWGSVDVSDLEEGATLYVYKDGEAQEITGNVITKSGKYELIVKDAAGNKSSYNFTIMIYLDAAGLAFFLTFVVLVAAVGAFIVFSRKKMRIR